MPTPPLTANVYHEGCPSRIALRLITGRWTPLVVGALAERPHQFGELRRRVEGVSQKMLTQTLRELVTEGIVTRTATGARPAPVTYQLTPLGWSLVDVLASVRSWAEDHIVDILEARAARLAP